MTGIKRKYFSIPVAIGLILMAVAGCSRPKTIPDNTLSDIFRDLYTVNAYVEKNNRDFSDIDSMDIYEPVLERYGYTAEDFNHTLADFSRRKSARVSDIVEDAVKKLDVQYATYTRRVETLDLIDSIAYAHTNEVVYSDSLIRVRSVADTALLNIKIPAGAGKYKISYYYKLDSLDKNTGLINRHAIYKSANAVVDQSTNRPRAGERRLVEVNLNSSPEAQELRLSLGGYDSKVKNPNYTIDSLVVVRSLPRHEALVEISRILIPDPFKDFPYESSSSAADSSQLHIIPPFAPVGRDSIPES